MTVSFVVATFRRPETVAATLRALARVDSAGEPFEIVVVDNADDSATAKVVRDVAESCKAVRYEVERTPGAAAARNRGARVASGELLVLCDDDIIVEPSHLRLQLGTREQYGECLVNGSWEFSPATSKALRSSSFGRYRLRLEEQFRLRDPGARRLDDSCLEVDVVSACNLAISRDLFLRLGGFDEEFPFAGAEDRDFSIRAARAGARLIRNEEIRLLHSDQTITFPQFCGREERSAATVAVLAGKHPDVQHARAFTSVNGPITRSDSPRTAAKKGVKRILAFQPMLWAAHQIIEAGEALGINDRALSRAYRAVIGVHIFRGFRRGSRMSHR